MIRWYLRVSTDEQGDSGLGLEAQERAIRNWSQHDATHRVYQDVASAKNLERPQLTKLLAELEPGDTLAVAKLDRLTRSVVDFGQLIEAAKDGGWYIVALDLGVDTSTPTGQLVANIMVSVSQWERQIIGQRTKEALAEKKANGQTLGRPVEVSADALQTIMELHDNGYGPSGIAEKLNWGDVPAPRGGKWHASTVMRIVNRELQP